MSRKYICKEDKIMEDLQVILIQNFMARLQKFPQITSPFMMMGEKMLFKIRDKKGNINVYYVIENKNKYELFKPESGADINDLTKYKSQGVYNSKKLVKKLEEEIEKK